MCFLEFCHNTSLYTSNKWWHNYCKPHWFYFRNICFLPYWYVLTKYIGILYKCNKTILREFWSVKLALRTPFNSYHFKNILHALRAFVTIIIIIIYYSESCNFGGWKMNKTLENNLSMCFLSWFLAGTLSKLWHNNPHWFYFRNIKFCFSGWVLVCIDKAHQNALLLQ